MEKILVSACLLGHPVRYDGAGMAQNHPLFQRWKKEGRLIGFCPEVSGGLPTPRPPAEIQGGTAIEVMQGCAQVRTAAGKDLSRQFIQGAELALALCLEHQITLAILSESSPSCGSTSVYDGSFSRHKIDGVGVTTAMLISHGIKVFSQHRLEDADEYLKRL